MNLALIQPDIAWKDIKANLQKANDFIQQASMEKCDVVVFSEMFHTGFCMDTDITTKDSEKIIEKLSYLAKKYDINIIAGLAKQDENNNHNIAITINKDGKQISEYIKNYSFSLGKENLYYRAGEKQSIYEIDGIRASTFICYDLRFAELFRKVAQSVKIIFVIASWPQSRIDHWSSLLKARAIENQCFVVGVNRIGKDGNDIRYNGATSIYNPLGEEVLKMGENIEYKSIDIDVYQVDKIRRKFPFLKDMK